MKLVMFDGVAVRARCHIEDFSFYHMSSCMARTVDCVTCCHGRRDKSRHVFVLHSHIVRLGHVKFALAVTRMIPRLGLHYDSDIVRIVDEANKKNMDARI